MDFNFNFYFSLYFYETDWTCKNQVIEFALLHFSKYSDYLKIKSFYTTVEKSEIFCSVGIEELLLILLLALRCSW